MALERVRLFVLGIAHARGDLDAVGHVEDPVEEPGDRLRRRLVGPVDEVEGGVDQVDPGLEGAVPILPERAGREVEALVEQRAVQTELLADLGLLLDLQELLDRERRAVLILGERVLVAPIRRDRLQAEVGRDVVIDRRREGVGVEIVHRRDVDRFEPIEIDAPLTREGLTRAGEGALRRHGVLTEIQER